jgi:hypothetical protein
VRLPKRGDISFFPFTVFGNDCFSTRQHLPLLYPHRLRGFHVRTREQVSMDANLWELYEDGNDDGEVAAIIRLEYYVVLPEGVRIITQSSEINSICTTRKNLLELSGAAEVADIEAGDTHIGFHIELESADLSEISSDTILQSEERRPEDERGTGQGVVVGVVDWGCLRRSRSCPGPWNRSSPSWSSASHPANRNSPASVRVACESLTL